MTVHHRSNSVTLGVQRLALEAVIIPACSACGAPGRYLSHDSIRIGWPGCHVEAGHGLENLEVGRICPNCGAVRPANRPQGELAASMPMWRWRLVLAFKWCLIKLKALRRR